MHFAFLEILTGQRNKVELVSFGVCVYGTDCDDWALSGKVVVIFINNYALDECAFFLFKKHSVVKAYLLTDYADKVSSQWLSDHIEAETILLNAKIVCNYLIFFPKLLFFHYNLNFGFEVIKLNYLFGFDSLEFFELIIKFFCGFDKLIFLFLLL